MPADGMLLAETRLFANRNKERPIMPHTNFNQRIRRNQSRAHDKLHADWNAASTWVKAQRTRQMQGDQKTTSDREATDPAGRLA